jgi:small nuclear ribonucleoprotein
MALQLKDGRVIEGKLVGFDQYMNLVLEESEERHTPRTGGAAAAAATGEEGTSAAAGTMTSRRLGTVILRGNNVVTIAPQ